MFKHEAASRRGRRVLNWAHSGIAFLKNVIWFRLVIGSGDEER